MAIQGFIFDLDGVLTDTAVFHYEAWKKLADEEGADFDWEINHKLRGVSRRNSMDIIFKGRDWTEAEIHEKMDRKNRYYQERIAEMTPEDVLPGVRRLLAEIKAAGMKIGLGSASKNARTVLRAIGLMEEMDVIGDGYSVSKSKPAPDLFLFVAREMALPPEDCVVLEDAAAGIEAAQKAGMQAVGIGRADRLPGADVVYPSLENLPLDRMIADLAVSRGEEGLSS
jgi:kojibiose phosphorylase